VLSFGTLLFIFGRNGIEGTLVYVIFGSFSKTRKQGVKSCHVKILKSLFVEGGGEKMDYLTPLSVW
jgi:hypothetical protein